MHTALDVVGLVAEIFAWVGFGGAVFLGVLTFALWAADGTWLPARGVVEPVGEGLVVRWIDDRGAINEAPLSPVDAAGLGGRDMADIHFRRGATGRMRLTADSPAVRGAGRLALGALILGILSLAVQLVVLFVQG